MLGRLCVLLAVLACGTTPLSAQTTTGTLRGTVTDGSGAILPGATVELTGAAGKVTAISDVNGQYRFQALTPGVYALQATLVPRLPLAPTFAAALRDGLLDT